MHIRESVAKTKGRPTNKEPKTSGYRDLPIDDPEFWDHVRPFLTATGFLFEGFYRGAPRTGPNVERKPWHPDHAEKRFVKLRRALGLSDQYTLHTLRHYTATQLLIQGMPINQVAEFLGHSPQMTLNLYGRHLDHDAMREVGRTATRLVSAASERTPGKSRTETPRKTEPVPQEVVDDAIFTLAKKGPITNAAVRDITDLTSRQASRALDRLVKSGRLERIGTKRGTSYRRVV